MKTANSAVDNVIGGCPWWLFASWKYRVGAQKRHFRARSKQSPCDFLWTWAFNTIKNKRFQTSPITLWHLTTDWNLDRVIAINAKNYWNCSKMLVQGPCGPPRHSFLLFLMPELDSPGRKTGHMFPVIHISKVNVKKNC